MDERCTTCGVMYGHSNECPVIHPPFPRCHTLPCGILVEMTAPNEGRVSDSDLGNHFGVPSDDRAKYPTAAAYDAAVAVGDLAIDTIERCVEAHAIAGRDLQDPEFQRRLTGAIEHLARLLEYGT